MLDEVETRTVLALRTGTKICALIAVAFIAVAVYFYFIPETSVRSTSGAVFGCGTAAHPTSGPFAEGVCWRITDVNKYRAIAAAAVGVLTLSIGAALFGVDRRNGR